jgi:hypothetical protein
MYYESCVCVCVCVCAFTWRTLTYDLAFCDIITQNAYFNSIY